MADAPDIKQMMTTLSEAVKPLTTAVNDLKTALATAVNDHKVALTEAVDKVAEAVAPPPAPDPFKNPDAKKAVETFNGIVAGLKLNPRVPVLKTATAVSTGEIKLEWEWTDDAAFQANGFKIERREDTTPTFIEIAPQVPASDRNFTDRGLVSKKTYHYKLRASTNRGDSPYTTELPATTL